MNKQICSTPVDIPFHLYEFVTVTYALLTVRVMVEDTGRRVDGTLMKSLFDRPRVVDEGRRRDFIIHFMVGVTNKMSSVLYMVGFW